MIAIDAVHDALRSPQAWSALDELVRTELAAGRLTDHIHDELAATLDEVRAAPDHDEDREEPLLDTLDRLNGFCRADIAYQNPPVLPTEDEIAKLPRWARVAFAARCARRSLSSVPKEFGGFDLGLLVSTTRAVEAAAVSLSFTLGEFARRIVEVIAVDSADLKYIEGPTSNSFADYRKFALKAVVAAVRAADSYANATEVFTASSIAGSDGVARSLIRRDFDHLARLASAYGWTDNTPVPPEVFGPLWPEGKPAGWPDDPELPKRTDVALEVVSSERVSETMIEDEVVNLFLAMNRFHIARTGHPLTVEDFHPFVAALVPAGV